MSTALALIKPIVLELIEASFWATQLSKMMSKITTKLNIQAEILLRTDATPVEVSKGDIIILLPF